MRNYTKKPTKKTLNLNLKKKIGNLIRLQIEFLNYITRKQSQLCMLRL